MGKAKQRKESDGYDRRYILGLTDRYYGGPENFRESHKGDKAYLKGWKSGEDRSNRFNDEFYGDCF
jgi:hypothetical protein